MDFKTIDETLNALLLQHSASHIITVKKLAEIIGLTTKTLRMKAPGECKYLVERNRIIRANNIAQREDRVRKAIETLISNGVYPSRRKVETTASIKELAKSRQLLKIWKETLAGCNFQ